MVLVGGVTKIEGNSINKNRKNQLICPICLTFFIITLFCIIKFLKAWAYVHFWLRLFEINSFENVYISKSTFCPNWKFIIIVIIIIHSSLSSLSSLH